MNIENHIKPNLITFSEDPFSYSALGRIRWGIIAAQAGFDHLDLDKPATTEELKNPVLWMTQAEALSQAAVLVLKSEPSFSNMPDNLRGICDGQFRSTGLMLVGYSLEICLKAMMIIEKGVDAYVKEEKNHRHHRLHKLATFVPDLTKKEIVILELLTHYIYWAGRYPDPGYGSESKAEEIFILSEKHSVTLHDLLCLAVKIMEYTKVVTKKKN
ncbi:hypothetical protein [Pantoea eucrina]|uniref:hypothetical protein n=1 Tax=Pantoea eucrina TaxID=472693 RepID=UPI003CED0935